MGDRIHRYDAIRLAAGEPRANAAEGGLDRVCIRSKSEVARMLGISRQAVYQIERLAIGKIRKALEPVWKEMGEDSRGDAEARRDREKGMI